MEDMVRYRYFQHLILREQKVRQIMTSKSPARSVEDYESDIALAKENMSPDREIFPEMQIHDVVYLEKKGVEFMCREMEQIYSEGIESGELKKAKASALSMAADGMKVDKIAHYLNVSVQMVQKWIDESMSVTKYQSLHDIVA